MIQGGPDLGSPQYFSPIKQENKESKDGDIISDDASSISSSSDLVTTSQISTPGSPQVVLSKEGNADSVETDWRSNEKYNLVLGQIHGGIKEIISDDPEQTEHLNSLESKGNIDKGVKGSQDETDHYIKKSLDYLGGTGDREFPNERERYKTYKSNLRKGLETEYYKKHCQDNPAPVSIRLLNSMCCAEFTKVNVQAFTQSVAEGVASTHKTSSIHSPDLPPSPKSFIGKLEELDSFHKAAGNKEGIGQKVKGEIRVAGFDPSVQGNPPNVKFRVLTKEGKTVTDIRTPTPTGADAKVNPEFKAFLRHLKANGQKYTMINLQNRTNPPAWKKMVSLDGEYVRSKNLEELGNDPEFKDTLTVFTLDKNSHFYKQEDTAPKSAVEFHKEFMSQMTNPKSGIHLPDNWKKDGEIKPEYKGLIENKLKFIHENFFDNKESLSSQERKDFIELGYLMLTDLFIKETGADFYNTSCKDCIDRGGGANWLMLAFMTLLETVDHTRQDNTSTSLEQRIDSLPAKLEEDALWARKRGVVGERLERAHSAIVQAANKLDNNPELALKIGEELNFLKLTLPYNENQRTKDPKLTITFR